MPGDSSHMKVLEHYEIACYNFVIMENPNDSPPAPQELPTQPDANQVISFGRCLRYMDMNLDRLRNDVKNGIAPSIRYGVNRGSGSYECVSVTALSNEPDLSQRIDRVARGNMYYKTLFHDGESNEGEGYIPFAYVLDFQQIAHQPNVDAIQQNWGRDLEPEYEGLEKLITTPGQRNHWQGEVRITFKDIMKEKCIGLDACKGIIVRERDAHALSLWISRLRLEGLEFPKIPIFSARGEKFLAFA